MTLAEKSRTSHFNLLKSLNEKDAKIGFLPTNLPIFGSARDVNPASSSSYMSLRLVYIFISPGIGLMFGVLTCAS